MNDYSHRLLSSLSSKVIGCAIEVHKYLGPGLLESTYERCLEHELKNQFSDVRSQYPIPVEYKGIKFNCAYRADIVVDQSLIIEIKSTEQIANIHKAQILTYMKLLEAPVSLIINFNATTLKNNIKRFTLFERDKVLKKE